jgi:(R,R)-butanediol dehydrogenase / meso-butanediol dehydrogenase / diacetyl reductase
MRAAVWHGAGDVRVQEWPDPGAPGTGQALVEVTMAAICGTDLAEYRDGPHMIPVSRPHPLTGRTAPVVLGHEYVGRVLAVGEGVEGLQPGDRVCGDSCLRCGRCYWCLRGEYNVCRLGASVGLHADGAFAPLIQVPSYVLEKVPDAVEDGWAAVAEPMAVGLHAINQGGMRPGDTVVVVGFGMIGAAAASIAKAAGAAAVFAIDPQPHRRDLARRMGVTDAFDPATPDLRRELYRRTSSVGADLVIDCTGRPETFAQSLELARRGGCVLLCGLGHEPAGVDLNRIVYFERRVVGVLGYRFDHQAVLGLMAARRIDPSPLLGDVISLDDVVVEGFVRMLRDPEAPLRVLVAPQQTGGGQQ